MRRLKHQRETVTPIGTGTVYEFGITVKRMFFNVYVFRKNTGEITAYLDTIHRRTPYRATLKSVTSMDELNDKLYHAAIAFDATLTAMDIIMVEPEDKAAMYEKCQRIDATP